MIYHLDAIILFGYVINFAALLSVCYPFPNKVKAIFVISFIIPFLTIVSVIAAVWVMAIKHFCKKGAEE